MPDKAVSVVIDFPRQDDGVAKLRNELMAVFAELYRCAKGGELDRCGILLNIEDACGVHSPRLLGVYRKDTLAAKSAVGVLQEVVDHVIFYDGDTEKTPISM